MKIYGIPNCDTTQKALKLLKSKGIEYEFHDYKKSGITEAKLKKWMKEVDWTILLNKRGTTWKALDPETQNSVISAETAIPVMIEYPSLIKRPVIETKKGLVVGLTNFEF